MKTMTIPKKFYIHEDQFGRIAAWTKTEVWQPTLATITVNQKSGVLAACPLKEYVAGLRKKAVRAYKQGKRTING